jgi:hypothetical protein
MKTAKAPDRRPAIAFDSKSEVLSIINALRLYRFEISGDTYINQLQRLIEECEDVLDMFQGNGDD